MSILKKIKILLLRKSITSSMWKDFRMKSNEILWSSNFKFARQGHYFIFQSLGGEIIFSDFLILFIKY